MGLYSDQRDVVALRAIYPEDAARRRRVVFKIRLEHFPTVSPCKRIDLVTLQPGMEWILLETPHRATKLFRHATLGLRKTTGLESTDEPIPFGLHFWNAGNDRELRQVR